MPLRVVLEKRARAMAAQAATGLGALRASYPLSRLAARGAASLGVPTVGSEVARDWLRTYASHPAGESKALPAEFKAALRRATSWLADDASHANALLTSLADKAHERLLKRPPNAGTVHSTQEERAATLAAYERHYPEALSRRMRHEA